MTRVKICGITNLEDLVLASELGADEIGLNFYERSKRYISPKDAALLVKSLGRTIKKIGVFVNTSVDGILRARDLAELDAIQLHGDETPAFISEIRKRADTMIIKAVRVTDDSDAENIDRFQADAILLDAYSPGERGGTGVTFDWKIAGDARNEVASIYLAGGLTPTNVAEAIRTALPYAVDVASGVESDPGKKDPAKLKAFIHNAKNA